MNGNSAINEHRTLADYDNQPECEHPAERQYVYADPNTGRAYYGCRSCGMTVGPVTPCLDDLTARPRPCGCVGSEQSCAACREAASLAELNKRAAGRDKPWRFDVVDSRLRAHQSSMTLRFFVDTAEAWQWAGAQ